MEFITPDWPAPPNVAALSTTRIGGVSKAPYDDGSGGGGLNFGTHVNDDPADVARNRALLRQLLPDEPAWLTQVHGAGVVEASAAAAAGLAGQVPEADACIASAPGAVCVIQTADCLPVLFCDAAGKAVGAAHAGWRGLAGGVLEQTLARMRADGADDILAWLGPAIGPQAFEVGQDVLEAFAAQDGRAVAAFVPAGGSGKYLADIYALARLALHRAGVRSISGGGLCTVADSARFYSYRRDRVTGRMASLIWLR